MTRSELAPACYRVVVRHNLVFEIQFIDRGESDKVEDDPLEVSSQLARNNLIHGRLDGMYDFETFEAARYFATLCTEYLEKLCQRSSEALQDLQRPENGPWKNPFIPRTGS